MDPSRLTMALWGNGYAPENDAISFARQKDREQARKELAGALMETWPVQMAKSAVGAAALPGDVYAGRVDPTSEVGIQRAADLAGFTTLGSFAASRPTGSVGMGGRPEKGIRAYHGSPHDFDRFDMSKIGTGEGAQAYGHGLYFAESEDVARKYRDALSPYGKLKSDNGIIDYNTITDPVEKMAVSALLRDSQPHNAKYIAGNWALPKGVSREDVMNAIDRMAAQNARPAGNMYEVNIRANPDDFLDWDKPIGQQSETAMNAVRGVLRQQGYLREGENGPRQLASALKAWGMENGGFIKDAPMSDVVRKMFGDPEKTANTLREAGIPGIKYLDQGSRAAGDGSRNYVVFDDKLIEILRKYGLTGLLGLGAVGGAYQTQSQEGGT